MITKHNTQLPVIIHGTVIEMYELTGSLHNTSRF